MVKKLVRLEKKSISTLVLRRNVIMSGRNERKHQERIF